jgi:hypothetical protein
MSELKKKATRGLVEIATPARLFQWFEGASKGFRPMVQGLLEGEPEGFRNDVLLPIAYTLLL